MENLIEKLKEIRPDIDFENETNLIDGKHLASFDIIQIVGMIEEEYDVKIPVSQLKPENFNSAAALYALIQKLEDE